VKGNTVLATSRTKYSGPPLENVQWIYDIDVASQDAGKKLVAAAAASAPVDIVIISAGYFGKESFDEPDWESEVKMYTTSAIGPVFLVHHLVKAGIVTKGAKILLVSSESGSITLRHKSEGGGNYGHHASKAALNMVGKLLSLDLEDQEIAVGLVHVSHANQPSMSLP
jgi:short-subunit dehydrogenase